METLTKKQNSFITGAVSTFVASPRLWKPSDERETFQGKTKEAKGFMFISIEGLKADLGYDSEAWRILSSMEDRTDVTITLGKRYPQEVPQEDLDKYYPGVNLESYRKAVEDGSFQLYVVDVQEGHL